MEYIILIVPSLRGGGMERVAVRLASSLSNRGYKVSIVTLNNRKPFFDIPVNVDNIQPSYRADKLSNPLTILKTIFFIRNTIKSKKPTAILSFGETYNSLVIFSLLKIKTKLFVTNRASPLSSLNGFRGLINPIFYKHASGVIVQTEKAKNILSKHYSKSKINIIPNPVQLKDNSCTSIKENIILNIGYVGGQKNQDLLIEYFAELENWQDWILHIVGDGPNLSACIKKADQLGIMSNVKFSGALKHIENVYRSAKIFAFTSTSEGFPNVILEAMNFGLPCISFDCIAGPSEMIKDSYNGFLVPQYDKSTYINKLGLLMKDKNLQTKFSKRSIQSIKKYDIEKITDQTIDVILRK